MNSLQHKDFHESVVSVTFVLYEAPTVRINAEISQDGMYSFGYTH